MQYAASAIEAMLNGSLVANALAEYLGLDNRYFSRVREESLTDGVKLYKFKRVILVKLPKEVYELLKTHTAVVLTENDSEDDYDYVFNLTSKTKIGFWK